MDPFSRLLGSTVNDLECFGRKTKIDRYFKFSIFEGDPDGQFRIDPERGNLYVHRRLDREKRAVYLLTVRATNTGK